MLKGMKQVARAKAIYAYAAVKDDELSLKPGDIINVYKTELPDQGWWLGELNGMAGVFPENFVRLLPESEERHHQANDLPQMTPEHGRAPMRPVIPPQSKVVGLSRSKVQAANKKSKEQVKQSAANEISEGFDFIKSGSKLSHITAGRVRGPARRPPTRQDDEVAGRTSRSGLASSNELDSCWGRGRASESPGIFEEPPGRILPPREKYEEDIKKSFQPKNPYEENSKVVNQHPFKPNKRTLQSELVADAEAVVPVGEYNAMLQELHSLQDDLKEQLQTNERMVLTLRNFLQEEREKIAALTLEFDKIKKSVLSMVSFL